MRAVIDFLNSREQATILWGAVLLAYVWRKDHSIGASLIGVVRAMLTPKLLLVWALAAGYGAALVFGAHEVGLWRTSEIKETVYWFVATAAVLTGQAMTSRDFGRTYIEALMKKAVHVTLIIEFLVNLYVLRLAAELVLVPLVATLLAMHVVAERDPALAAVKKLLDGTLILIGLAVLAWATFNAATDLRGLLTREHAQQLLLIPAFTLGFVPFLYATWRWSRWELEQVSRRWRDPTIAIG